MLLPQMKQKEKAAQNDFVQNDTRGGNIQASRKFMDTF